MVLGLRLSKCQHFQENVNETRNSVNDIRKTVNSFSKSTVNHNQEKDTSENNK